MKMSSADYSTIVDTLRSVAGIGGRSFSQWLNHYRDNGIGKDPEKRLRWDAFAASTPNGMPAHTWIVDHLYPKGLDDSHIDTALRRAFRKVSAEGL